MQVKHITDVNTLSSDAELYLSRQSKVSYIVLVLNYCCQGIVLAVRTCTGAQMLIVSAQVVADKMEVFGNEMAKVL